MTPLKFGIAMGERIAGAKTVVIPNAGHFLPAETPFEVNAALQRFLQTNSPTLSITPDIWKVSMMDEPIFRKIAVIGAGTMGSGIAAQIANAGHEVLLLDLAARDGDAKSPAEMAIDRLIASDPPQLMHKKNTALITTGTINDDFHKLADCDWIIEAVVERLDIKKALYKRLG